MKTDELKQYILNVFEKSIEDVEKAAEKLIKDIDNIYLTRPSTDRRITTLIKKVNNLIAKLPTIQTKGGTDKT